MKPRSVSSHCPQSSTINASFAVPPLIAGRGAIVGNGDSDEAGELEADAGADGSALGDAAFAVADSSGAGAAVSSGGGDVRSGAGVSSATACGAGCDRGDNRIQAASAAIAITARRATIDVDEAAPRRRRDFFGTTGLLRHRSNCSCMSDQLATALDGVRVVALATNIPGPLAAARLRALGATVTKIEPIAGDPLHHAAPRWYAHICAGIEIVALNPRDPGERERLHERVRDADVLITTMRESALARLDLDWEKLHAAAPRTIHVAVVGEGPPHADRAGHDLTYQAKAGLISPPAMPRTLVADLAAAERVVSAILAALLLRARDGVGIRTDVAIVDAALEFNAPLRFGLTGATDSLGGGLPAYNLYRASDGWIAVAALEAHFAERLRDVLQIETLDTESLRDAFSRRTLVQWEALAEEADLPLAAVPVWDDVCAN
jgi:crotonobetainyl-CoA:carnitine CoA-transferase CaiB-like acyl-CoA transferase